jgi:predicted protein tyrosine phosphatase
MDVNMGHSTQNQGLTEKIFQLSAPFDNPYQGPRNRMLFVCSAGLLRSPTGAHVANQRGYNARSCGSHMNYALIPMSVNLIVWANHIVFVNKENYDESIKVFTPVGYNEDIQSKAIVLNIPDSYNAFSSFLIQRFNDWFDEWEYVDKNLK